MTPNAGEFGFEINSWIAACASFETPAMRAPQDDVLF